jgi:hypothetical protein
MHLNIAARDRYRAEGDRRRGLKSEQAHRRLIDDHRVVPTIDIQISEVILNRRQRPYQLLFFEISSSNRVRSIAPDISSTQRQ